MKEDDFHYAIENTQVIVAPEQQIATFGSTSFDFYLISELMDRVDQVRVRNGKIQAERPQIVTPEHFRRLLLEGFGEKARRYAERRGRWFILSALHGLLDPSAVIAPYDVTLKKMPAAKRKEWGQKVREQMEAAELIGLPLVVSTRSLAL